MAFPNSFIVNNRTMNSKFNLLTGAYDGSKEDIID